MAAELAASAAELAAREQHVQTERPHRALQTDDVLTSVFSRLALRDGCVVAASVCKQWRGAWRRHAKGLYRPIRVGVGHFKQGDHLTVLDGVGVVVPDCETGILHLYSSEGERLRSGVTDFYTPVAVALDHEGDAWIAEQQTCRLGSACIDWEAMEPHDEPCAGSYYADDFGQPMDVATSGDAVVVLTHVEQTYGRVIVLDRNTAWVVSYMFGSSTRGGIDELRGAMGLALDGDFCFVADTFNQSIAVFNWRDGTFVRRYGKAGDAPELADSFNYWEVAPTETYDDDRKSAAPGEFNEPYDVVARNKLLYVSERGGRRIQILRLPDDLGAADPEVLQIIPSPGGVELAGLCLDGDRLWCIETPYHVGYRREDFPQYYGHASSISIFAPIV